MRLCSYRGAAGRRPGIVTGDQVVPLAAESVLHIVRGAPVAAAGPPEPLGSVELLAPIRPGTLIGIGLNYRAHAEETGMEPPLEPLLFSKMPASVTGPSGPVWLPPWTSMLDYEGELGVVIGRRASHVGASDALDHVFGYLVIDDISARDRQREEPQWIRAKGGEGFGPMGPWITTADEVPDPQALRIRTWVNGDLRQDGNTADMIFPVADLIAFISHAFPLEPGDIIATGTPDGVGVARSPRLFLADGDVVRVEVDALGAIEHPVRCR